MEGVSLKIGVSSYSYHYFVKFWIYSRGKGQNIPLPTWDSFWLAKIFIGFVQLCWPRFAGLLAQQSGANKKKGACHGFL